MSRTKNASRNIIWGIINKVIAIIIPFILRTMVIYLIGIQYVGLNSLFASILGVLSLAELGFGTALVYSMYKPIAENDIDTVNALLNLYRKIYRWIGGIIFIFGLVIMPFLDLFIAKDYPKEINIYILYFISLLNTTLGYFLFSYKRSILNATQRVDIGSNINTAIQIVQFILQSTLLFVFKNYYIYIIVLPLLTIIDNIIVAYFVKKMYPQYTCQGNVEKTELATIKKNVGGLLIQKIGNTILNSSDNIILSAFLGLTLLAKYNNYYYIMSAVFGVLFIITNAITPIIGNSIVKESLEKNYKDFIKFNFIEVWLVTWFAACLMALYQHFMMLWGGPEFQLSIEIAILFVIYFFVYKMNDMCYVYRQASGIWWEGRWMPFVSAVVNLTLNLLLINRIGMIGVLLSTIVSILFINFPWGTYILFAKYFKAPSKTKVYIWGQVKSMIIAGIVITSTFFVSSLLEGIGWIDFILKLVICALLPNILLFVIYSKNEVFIETKTWIFSRFLRK